MQSIILEKDKMKQIGKSVQVKQTSGDDVRDIERFEHLRFILQNDGCFLEDMRHSIKGGWIKWR